MLKKLLAFMCGLVPFGAGAANIEPVVVTSPSTTAVTVSDSEVKVATGETLQVYGANVQGGSALNVGGDMRVFMDATPQPSGGTLFVDTDATAFSLQVEGDVDVSGTLMVGVGGDTVARTFNISNYTDDGVSFNVDIGNVVVNSAKTFNVTDVNHFNAGVIETSGVSVAVLADYIQVGTITRNAGDITLAAGNLLSLDGFSDVGTDAATINMSAAEMIVYGDVENNVGTMTWDVADAASVMGGVSNSGGKLFVEAGDVDIDGALKNDGGRLEINAGALTVNGGDASNSSFVNNGDAKIVVGGNAVFANGITLVKDENSWGNSFYLNANTLSLGGDTTDFFANRLNDYQVVVNSEFSAGDVSNGSADSSGLINNQANMLLAAGGLTIDDAINYAGTMTLKGLGDTALVVNSVSDMTGANTVLTSGGNVVAQDVLVNGTMTLTGAQVSIGQVVGNGGDLSVIADGGNGLITVDGGLLNKNSGTVDLTGGQISIAGNVDNQSGNLIVNGLDAVHLGGLNVSGGFVDLDGFNGIDVAQTTSGAGVAGAGTLVVANGVLSFGPSTNKVTVSGPADATGYVVNIAGDVVASAAPQTAIVGAGDVYVSTKGPVDFTLNATGNVNVGGDIVANADDIGAHTLNFEAGATNIVGNVLVAGSDNRVVFQGQPTQDADATMTQLTVGNDITVSDGGAVEIHSLDTVAGTMIANGGTIYAYGDGMNAVLFNATMGGISIANGIVFDDLDDDINVSGNGLIVANASSFTLMSGGVGQDITINGGVHWGDGAALSLKSAQDISVGGAVYANGTLNLDAARNVMFADDVNVAGALNIEAAADISLQDITNNGDVVLTAGSDVNIGVIKNDSLASGATYNFDVVANDGVIIDAVESENGTLRVGADSLTVNQSLGMTGGTIILNVPVATFGGNVEVAGILSQGTNQTGMLNLLTNNMEFNANSLTTGGFVADSLFAEYNINNDLTIGGDITISAATVHFHAQDFYNTNNDADNPYVLRNAGAFQLVATGSATFDDIINLNSGAMTIRATDGITMGTVVNSARMSINSGDTMVNMVSLANNDGRLSLSGAGLDVMHNLTMTGDLYQGYTGALYDGDIEIGSDAYSVTASNMTMGGINQVYGNKLGLFSGDITINGDITVSDLTVSGVDFDAGLDLAVNGNIFGGTKILGVGHMVVNNGDYVFDKNSQLMVDVSGYSGVSGGYWSDVNLESGADFGKITNATDGTAGALISVHNGQFISGSKYDSNMGGNAGNSALGNGQIGISFSDLSNYTPETAIWLLSADKGLVEFSELDKMRNLTVLFCNADNTICAVLDNEKLGAYIAVRDALNVDGIADSLYVVFDPSVGGPVFIDNNRIQPIVARQPGYTSGEYGAAGALDNLVAGQLINTGYFKQTPIEVIPKIFENTNVEVLMTELYNRMERYAETADGSIFVPFSQLVQPREIEQIAGAIVMNEHTASRNFEDRMMDEFIWNRNRNLQKTWTDFDLGMFSQNIIDDGQVYGSRFEWSGGFDWQETDTLILGLTGRISHTSSDNDDNMNLSYLPGTNVAGNVSVQVDDTNVGLGAYLIKTLGQKSRLYGNAFLDLHLLDTTRYMTFMDTIEGSGTALSLMTEWGLMHDWLNQYIVGNLYARAGYNFGFSVTEQAADENYMDLESDGYMMFTPGYSLMAQKRIYPSAWFQIRPYATIGVEYDVLGVPDYVKYKFAAADTFTDYDIEINPLWANIGGGFEFLSANGLQFGVDYRYQYNNDMQLHNIKLSGSYRF